MHRYHLDDDKNLMSGLLTVFRENPYALRIPWTGQYIQHTEIPHFYGQSVSPPYPQFIAEDGSKIMQIDTLL